jgi:hypothetical protein
MKKESVTKGLTEKNPQRHLERIEKGAKYFHRVGLVLIYGFFGYVSVACLLFGLASLDSSGVISIGVSSGVADNFFPIESKLGVFLLGLTGPTIGIVFLKARDGFNAISALIRDMEGIV